MVVRGSSKTEADRWYQALLSHVNYKGNSLLHAYVRPQPIPKEPKLFKDIVILDLGSSSVRAGILSAHGIKKKQKKNACEINHGIQWENWQIGFSLIYLFSLWKIATLPQVFFPSVAAVDKTSGHYVAFGQQAVLPEVRANSTLAHPLRSQKISKVFISFFLQALKSFSDLLLHVSQSKKNVFSLSSHSLCWIWKGWPDSSGRPSCNWTLSHRLTEFRLKDY